MQANEGEWGNEKKKKSTHTFFGLLYKCVKRFAFFFSFVCFDLIAFGSLQTGKHDEAWMVLKHIHDTNMRARGEPERVFTVSRCLLAAPTPLSPQSGNRSVSPPAGQQDQDPQAAGRAGGDAERVSQPGAQGAVQDQGRAPRGAFLLLLLPKVLPRFPETLNLQYLPASFFDRSG